MGPGLVRVPFWYEDPCAGREAYERWLMNVIERQRIQIKKEKHAKEQRQALRKRMGNFGTAMPHHWKQWRATELDPLISDSFHRSRCGGAVARRRDDGACKEVHRHCADRTTEARRCSWAAEWRVARLVDAQRCEHN